MAEDKKVLTGFQLRRMGFPQDSRYSIVRKLFIGDLFVGRYLNPTANQLNLVSTYVSKTHCRIECLPNGQIFLHDISSNGTFVNGINYKQTTIELRDKDKIGVGFPVNESNAMNGKSFFGFILERTESAIKQEVKEEMRDDQDTEHELVIDENFRSRSVTPHSQPSISPLPNSIPEPPVAAPVQQNGIRIANCVSLPPDDNLIPIAEPVIAQVRQEDDELGIDFKEELIKRELEDDMGAFTEEEDDDEVEYVSSYKLDIPLNKNSSMPFPYIEQFSEAILPPDDESHQSSTQTLLSDLLGSESNETTAEPAENVPLVEENVEETPFRVPLPPKSPINDLQPSTSTALPNDSAISSNLSEVLRATDLDTVLNLLADVHGMDHLMKKFNEIKRKMSKDDHHEKSKDLNEKKKSSKNHKKSSNHKNGSKSKEKHSHEKPKEAPKPEKERRKSMEKPSTSSKDSKSVEKRRKSVPANSVEPEPVEDIPNEDEQHSPLQMYDEPEIETHANSRQNSTEEPEPAETPAGVKRKADDLVSPGFHTEKRRFKADFSDSLKKLRSVPDPIPIEELYSASQLPPPLEVVPEMKQPDYKVKLFNKTKERKAHNRVEKKESDKKLENKREKKEQNKKKDTPKTFKIPKVTDKPKKSPLERRDSDDGLKAFVKELEEATSDDPKPHENGQEAGPSKDPKKQKKENISENIPNKPLVASTPHKFAVPRAPDRRPSLDVPPSPFLSAETFNRESQQRKTPTLALRRQSLDVPPSPFLSSDPSWQRETSAIDVAPVIPYNCKDILSDVLSWNVDWIGAEDAPIVDNQKTLLGVSNTYPSYGHYVNVMVPLLKLELFHSIVEAYPRKIIKPPTKAILINNNGDYNNKFNNNKLISIQVKILSEISRENFFTNIRQGTLIVITTLAKEQFFGYITRVIDHNMKKITLSILVPYKFPFAQILNHQIDICFVEYIKVEMETFLMLKDLPQSPLLNLVLKPNLISYNKNVSKPKKIHGKEKLNEHQFMAMSQVTVNIDQNGSKPHVFLIEGPPGTGKSRLIASIIMQFVRSTENKNKNLRILVCAPSNNAVDVLTEKLITYRSRCQNPEDRKMLKIVRFGDKIGIKTVNEYSISSLLEAEVERLYTNIANQFGDDTEEQKERKSLMSKIHESYNMKRKTESSSERSVIEKEIFQLKLNLREIEKKMYLMRKTRRDMEAFRQKTRFTLLDGANIVASTLTSLPSLYNNCSKKFDIAIIDEATQATETSTLMTLGLGVRHLIMVGDTKQLPAMIRNQQAKELGLGTSLFARMRAASDYFLTLKKQYRMDPEILKFSNSYFYNNMIESGTVVYQKDSYNLKPYLVFELESEQNMTQNPHCYNTDEIDFVINLLRTITGLLPSNSTYSIGVVTPYAKQKQLIEKKLSQDHKPNISVYTIDAIQGQEKDIIVFSCVRTEGVGFLSSPERLNVALTRAKKSLFICGNFMSLRRVEIWEKLLADAERRNLYIDDIYDLPKHLLR
ncbi:uncharacterized protein LOC134828717 [Culicoides brevitarsis]|uniref:uncharacterized protein LOC134828717 n=1 Tax=Culicoides brevitarsis TaxID=469753 RepID=UPI00307B8462